MGGGRAGWKLVFFCVNVSLCHCAQLLACLCVLNAPRLSGAQRARPSLGGVVRRATSTLLQLLALFLSSLFLPSCADLLIFSSSFLFPASPPTAALLPVACCCSCSSNCGSSGSSRSRSSSCCYNSWSLSLFRAGRSVHSSRLGSAAHRASCSRSLVLPPPVRPFFSALPCGPPSWPEKAREPGLLCVGDPRILPALPLPAGQRGLGGETRGKKGKKRR
jgi:hypothetical protein